MSSFYTNIRLYKSSILHRWIDDNGNRKYRIEQDLQPTLFFNCNEDTGYKSLYGVNVRPVAYDEIRDANDAIKRFDGVSGVEIFGTRDWALQWSSNKYAGNIKYDISKIMSFFLDIEVSSKDGFPDPIKAAQEITSITIYSTFDKKYHVWSTKDFIPPLDDIVFICCLDERDLLTRMISFWRDDYPDIISGWYSESFDIPYLYNRIVNLFGEKTASQLSPFGKVTLTESGDDLSKEVSVDIYGIDHLDYLKLYKKYKPGGQSSFKLGYISELVLGVGETKIEFDGTLDDLWEQNPQLYIEYNIQDVRLLVRMDQKLKMIHVQVDLAYLAKTNFENVFSPVKFWSCLVYNELIKDNIVLPQDKRHRKDHTYEGAYVKETIAGLYKWVTTFDATSLYPSMVITFNISPETMVPANEVPDELYEYYRQNLVSRITNEEDLSNLYEILCKYDMTIAANGQLYYRNKQGIIPRLMKMALDNRSIAKKEMIQLKKKKESINDLQERTSIESTIEALSIREQGLKTVANSGYGALGSEFFILYDTFNAEAITLSGQASNLGLQRKVNKYFVSLGFEDKDYTLYADTDSCFLHLNQLVTKFNPSDPIDFLCKVADTQLQKKIDGFCNDIWKYSNVVENRLSFKREKVMSTVCFTGVKKRYFCYVYDNEGVRYSTPKLAITGLETNRSSTPKICREELENALLLIVQEKQDELIELVADVKTRFETLHIEEIAFPRSVNDLAKYSVNNDSLYRKGTPQQVKAALTHNFFIKEKGLNKYQPIKSGNKIKFVYMKPSPYRSEVFGWGDGAYPKELGLEKYVDRLHMFTSAFFNPIKNVTDSIGWQCEDTRNLSQWFS